jgi:hypothetical protein
VKVSDEGFRAAVSHGPIIKLNSLSVINFVHYSGKALNKSYFISHLSIDIATKLNIDDVEQITSIAI